MYQLSLVDAFLAFLKCFNTKNEMQGEDRMMGGAYLFSGWRSEKELTKIIAANSTFNFFAYYIWRNYNNH